MDGLSALPWTATGVKVPYLGFCFSGGYSIRVSWSKRVSRIRTTGKELAEQVMAPERCSEVEELEFEHAGVVDNIAAHDGENRPDLF